MSGEADPLDIASTVSHALDACSVEHYVTGSIASGILGQPRFTRDIDFVVHLRERNVGDVKAALGADFDVDEVALIEAVRKHSSWNIFHLPTMTRIDLFVLKDVDYDAGALLRRKQIDLGKGRTLWIPAPEDSILSKLRWFKQGDENDSKQLQDVADVIRAQGPRLDWHYLGVWADRLVLARLLERARKAAGVASSKEEP